MDAAIVQEVCGCFVNIAASAAPRISIRLPCHACIQRKNVQPGAINKAPVAGAGIPPGAEKVFRNRLPPHNLGDLALVWYLTNSRLQAPVAVCR